MSEVAPGLRCALPVRLFEYTRSANLGDEIQSHAVRQHLAESTVAGYVERDELDQVRGAPVAVVMNGWFTKRPETLPPSSSVRPVWIGFHLGSHVEHLLDAADLRLYLQRQGRIGCRDQATVEMLQRRDIDAFLSGCLSTTFPRRDREPDDGKVFLVDTTGVPLPDHLRGPGSVRVSHQGAPWFSQEAKRILALDLLALYRDQASLVVTTRLHCALPCLAMGIPVVFVGDPDDERLSPVRGLAECIPFPHALRGQGLGDRARRRVRWVREMQDQPWTGQAPDIEDAKRMRVALLADGLAAVTA